MTYITRVAACLGTILLATACAAPGSVAPGDGTWSAPGPGDFNTPTNWTPAVVPLGTATIPVGAVGGPQITFSVPSTSLGAIRIQGALGFDVEANKSLTLKGQGLTICCAQGGQAVIHGTLNGDVIIGDGSASGNALQGSGTINGNITQLSGGLTPGSSPSAPTMTVNGTYTLQPSGGMSVSIWGKVVNNLKATKDVILNGILAIWLDDQTPV